MEQKKIFISHSSLDTQIGEKFVDALVELGIEQNIIFFSSKYHTGVELGNDFHTVIKEQIKGCDIVIFLLTRNFYKSAACLNEMGAAWVLDKNILPILLDNLSPSDMKGFIDSHYIAFKPKTGEEFMLLRKLNDYIKSRNTQKTLEQIFNDFVVEANRLSAYSTQYIEQSNELSGLEEDILNKRFTDKEILLLNYFICIQNSEFATSNNETFAKYVKEYGDFDFNSALSLLSKRGYIELQYETGWDADENGNPIQEEYEYCEIEIDSFSDLISLGSKGTEYVEMVKSKYRKNIVVIKTEDTTKNVMDDYILNPDIRELEALLIAFMYDTATITLGDRWMADGTINNIIAWQTSNDVNDKLSRNYNVALRILNAKGILEPSNFTSYGNVKEFTLKSPYSEQILKISNQSQEVLNNTKKANFHNSDDDFPF